VELLLGKSELAGEFPWGIALQGSFCQKNFPARRATERGQKGKEGAFPRSVRASQDIMPARLKIQVYPLEDRVGTMAKAEVSDL
jgi:hypothetical protein